VNASVYLDKYHFLYNQTAFLYSGLQYPEANFLVPYTKSQILAYIQENQQALADWSNLESCKLVVNRIVEEVIITPEDVYIKYHFGTEVDKMVVPTRFELVSPP
jgi:hypothetical protein